MEDSLSIITVFPAKLYGSRSHKNKRIIESTKKLFMGDENAEKKQEKAAIQNETSFTYRKATQHVCKRF